MTAIKSIRLVLWVLVGAAAIAGAALFANQRSVAPLMPEIRLGAPFSLIDQTGASITEQAMAGRPHAVFFGFTHCPEICPTTLYEMSGWLDALGAEGAEIKVFFVSVDPERDTPDILSSYLSSFPRVTGITGDAAGVAALANSWKGYSRKVPLDDGGYTMDHTASVFLVRADGTLQGTIGYGENPETALEKLQMLAKG
jgi:protein SCO1